MRGADIMGIHRGGLWAAALAVLTGCGGSGGGGEGSGLPAQLSGQALVPAQTETRLTAYLRKGIDNLNSNSSRYTVAVLDAGAESKSIVSGFGFSGTNLIEQGVDEADLIKQNASHIFAIQQAQQVYYTQDMTVSSPATDLGQFRVNVFAKPDTQAVSSIELSGAYAQGLYLAGTQLASIATKQYAYWYYTGIAASRNGKTAVDMIDIANPMQPATKMHYEWDGDYVASRRIGDSIYVVTSVGVDAALISNASEARDNNSQIAEYLPVTASGQKVEPGSCLIPQTIEDENIVPAIILITQLSMTGRHEPRTQCVAASSPYVYAGTEAMYLLGQDWQHSDTRIHKFSLNDERVEYRASGAVPGYIAWQEPYLSMSEYKNVLRILTYSQTPEGVSNKLFTLKESTQAKGELARLAELPNAAHPEPIGKPNETIQAVRFLGETAYVVTFQVQDPLYKLDLSDPTAPKMLGQLEMPGYSAYLHPVSDRYVLGIGYSVSRGGRQDGIQLTVFDVSEDTPSITSQETIGSEGGWLSLPLDWDTHALSTLSNGDTLRVLLPYSLYSHTDYAYVSKLGHYAIDEHSGQLTHAGETAYSTPRLDSLMRAVLDGDAVYSLFSEGALERSQWGAGD